jgi:hypothetical protein
MAGSSTEYTSRGEVNRDLWLWMAWKKTGIYTLAMFQRLAEGRWQWMIDNWTSLGKTLENYSTGDEFLTSLYVSLENNIEGSKSGSNVNPMTSGLFHQQMVPLLDLIQISSLGLTAEEGRYFQEEVKRVSLFTSVQFKSMYKYIRSIRDLTFDRLGLGDDLYSEMFGRTTQKKIRDYTVEDLENVQSMINLENFILGIVLEFKNVQEKPPNLLQFAQDNLGESRDVGFVTAYKSYRSVPYGISLEQMAQDYLGSKSMWYELVTVNNLKPPYVDIVGIKEPLLESASGSSVHVSIRYAERMRIGTSLKIGSKVIPEEIRKIESFIDNKDGTASVLLNGLPNLSKFRANHDAYVRLFSPETLQEYSLVKIPFTGSAPSASTKPDPELQVLRNLDDALYDFGVDLAIEETTLDLNVSRTGDLKIRYGMAAVRQAVWNKLRTNQGQIPLHMSYGMANQIGNLMGGDASTALSSAVQGAIRQDSRFTNGGLSDIIASETGAVANVNVSVTGATGLLPFSFAL